MNKKVKIKNTLIRILLIIVIFILSLFIIVPPVLRLTIPNLNLGISISPKKDSNIIILSCEKYEQETQTLITSRTKYKDNNIEQNLIIYKKDLTGNNQPSSLPSYQNSTEAINFFSRIEGIEITVSEETTTVLIPKYVVENNGANRILQNYFQKKDSQKTFYESQGYVCTEIKS